jgi:AraC family transcriptional regulator
MKNRTLHAEFVQPSTRHFDSARSVKHGAARRGILGFVTTLNEATYRQRILAVQLYVQEHLDGDLSLDRLARVAHFSPCHFHRIFKAVVGEGTHEYVRRLRLESAAFALKTTDRSVVQVALDAGYGTHEAFTRAFRQTFDVSPSQYRAGRRCIPRPQETETMTTLSNPPTVKIETVVPRRVACIRHVGPYAECGPTFGRISAWAAQRGLFGPRTLVLGIFHDDPDVTPADKLRCDCGVTVADNVMGDGDVGIQSIPGGECAVLTHKGPYSGLPDTYRWLFGTWLPASGREPGDAPSYEVYLNSPMNAAPEELLTVIHLPLAAR